MRMFSITPGVMQCAGYIIFFFYLDLATVYHCKTRVEMNTCIDENECAIYDRAMIITFISSRFLHVLQYIVSLVIFCKSYLHVHGF